MIYLPKPDARHQTLGGLYLRRKKIVKLHCEGVAIMQIIKLIGLSYPTVRRVIDRYIEGGEDTLKPSARGKKLGIGRALTNEQERNLYQIICNPPLEQHLLWDRAYVKSLIERESKVKLSSRCVDSYIRRWGFLSLSPFYINYSQQPTNVRAWIDDAYGSLKQRAKDEGAEIVWAAKKILARPAQFKGESLELKSHRKLLQLVSVNNQNKVRWMVFDGTVTPEKLIKFFDALIRGVNRKVFLIMPDMLALHKKQIGAWIKKHAKQLKLTVIM